MNSIHATTDPGADLVRGLYTALEAGRPADALARIAPEVILHVPGRHPAAGDHVGHAGVADFLATSAAIAVTDESVEDVLVGDLYVAVVCRVRGWRSDGRTLDNTTIHRHRVERGLVEHGLIHEIWFHNTDQHAVDAFWTA